MELAVKEGDYLAQSFLQWFIDEQLEEVVKMERMLGVIKQSGEREPVDGRSLPGAHREGALIEQHYLEDCVLQLRTLKTQAEKAVVAGR